MRCVAARHADVDGPRAPASIGPGPSVHSSGGAIFRSANFSVSRAHTTGGA